MRPAGLRARERPGAGGSSGGESRESFGRLQEALWRLQRGLGRLQEILEGSGEVLGGPGEPWEKKAGLLSADLRSLNEYEVGEAGRGKSECPYG